MERSEEILLQILTQQLALYVPQDIQKTFFQSYILPLLVLWI